MGHTDVTEVPRIVAALRDTYKQGVTRPLEWRRRQLHSLRSLLEDNLEPITTALVEDLHKGRAEAAIAEVWDPLGQVSFMDQNLESLCGKEVLPTPIHQRPLSFEIWKEPFGVVTIIGPWNFPFSLLLNPLAGALAAGNTCVLKPSEVSVASGRLLAELVPKYFDPSVVAVVTGGVEQTTALLAEKVDNIMYTGGGVVGRIVMAAAAKNLTPVTLELGGKCPVYVDESADVQVAARRIVFGKSFNGGQACIAPDHVFVHAKVRDSFLRHLKTEHDRLFPGDEKENVDKARIVNDRHFQRVSRLLNENHGGKVVIGGGTVEAERFVEFTVVLDPSPDSALMQEEIFAPILPVMTVASVDEAIAFCGYRPTPLAAYVFQRDSVVCKKWLSEVASGGACVNDCVFHVMNNKGGLAGKGESGMGASRGCASFEAFTHRKVVGYQPATFDPLMKYPPFKGVPVTLKMLVTGDFPGWVKPAFWGVVLSTTAALALFVSKHVSLSVSVSFH